MNSQEFAEWMRLRFPSLKWTLTEFDSGAFIADLKLNGICYCIEFFPKEQAFGLSEAKQTSPFYEGVDRHFSALTELEACIHKLQ